MKTTPLIPGSTSPRLRQFARGLAVAFLAVLTTTDSFGEPPKGRLLASQCFQCHGTNGQAVGGFESISGKSAKEMFNELEEMSRRRPEGIMDLQARGFTSAQRQLIAEYLATLNSGSGNAGERESKAEEEDKPKSKKESKRKSKKEDDQDDD